MQPANQVRLQTDHSLLNFNFDYPSYSIAAKSKKGLYETYNLLQANPLEWIEPSLNCVNEIFQSMDIELEQRTVFQRELKIENVKVIINCTNKKNNENYLITFYRLPTPALSTSDLSAKPKLKLKNIKTLTPK